MPDDSLALLLVEDDPGTSASLSRILERNGYRVDTAATIAATLDRDNWSDYLAIILDRKLSDGMADDILPQLKQLAPDAALIVVTAYADLNGTIVALRQGVVDYFFKPLNPEILLASLTHIVERRRTTEALRESQERIQAILNTAADAIITINQRGIIDGVNAATEQMFGYTEDELVGENVSILMPAPYHDEHDGYITRYLETGRGMIGIGRELTGKRRDGSTVPVDLAVSEIDHLGRFTGVIRDISERKELQKQVLEIAAQEDRRIGHELHDNIQQQLTGLGLLAQTVADRLEAVQEIETQSFETAGFLETTDMASRVAEGISEAARHVHLLSRGLVPVEVNAEGLRASLTDLAATIGQQYSVQCDFRCEGAVEVSDNFVATHLYRIAQEAVNNVLKHGRAERIEISLTASDETITLNVLDDGIGIGDKREPGPGMGLRIMDYRAGLIGGTVHVAPGDEGGTRVTCTVLRRGG